VLILKLSAAAVLLMSLSWLPAWAAKVYYTTEQRPELCNQLDAYPKDHAWTGEETWERHLCQGVLSGGKRLYPTQEDMLAYVAERDAEIERKNEESMRNAETIELTPKVYDKDGNLLDEAAQQKITRDNWNKLIASGQCVKVAQDLVRNSDDYQRCHETGRRAKCEQYYREASVLSACAVSPDDPEHGYKRRAIRRDPMPTAIALANDKQPSEPANCNVGVGGFPDSPGTLRDGAPSRGSAHCPPMAVSTH
jgi:hypothetical protein